MMVRFCEGIVPCQDGKMKQGEKFYRINGPRTAFEWKELPLCDTCPEALRSQGHQVEEVIL